MPRVFYVLSMQGCNDVPLPSQAHGWGWGGLHKLPDAMSIRWSWSQRRLPRWKDASWEEARGRGWKRIPGEGTHRTNPETKKGAGKLQEPARTPGWLEWDEAKIPQTVLGSEPAGSPTCSS